MPETWLLVLLLLAPTGGIALDSVNGFESKRECQAFGARYKNVTHLWQVEYLCQGAALPYSDIPVVPQNDISLERQAKQGD
jgi:hypothetical protein